jgi:uncharacterized protein YegP (UPF0339 family)
MASRPFPSYWLYKDVKGEWRWTYHGKNGEEIAVSSEGYTRRAGAQHGIDLMQASANSPVWMPSEQVNDD